MSISELLSSIGYDKALQVDCNHISISDKKASVLSYLHKNEFNIDMVYFSGDFPAVCIKKITSFDQDTSKDIADLQRKIWNSKIVLFLFIYNDFEIRIYNCAEKPILKTKDTDYEEELSRLSLVSATISDHSTLQLIENIFSSIAIDSGLIWTYEDDLAEKIRNQIDIRRKVDKYLVKSLIKLAKDLYHHSGLVNIDMIHKIILRSLFLLYLEDRGATDEDFYKRIKEDARSYFDILDDVDATYELFIKLDTHFNGNIFSVSDEERSKIEKSHLEKIKKCFISGYEIPDQLEIFENWRLFDFKIIPIELLSEIYENFIANFNRTEQRKTGSFYTPHPLVELILNDVLPSNKSELDYNIKVLDPACGSGIFLVESYKRLIRRYEYKHGQRLTDYAILKDLLLNNIYGIDIDPLSVKIAAFSLYLALLEQIEPPTIWQTGKLPLLINSVSNNLSENGSNLFVRDTISEDKEIDSLRVDLVIGNPPFGVKNLLPSVKKYCQDRNFAPEMVIPFLHKATYFAPNGLIALIITTKILTNPKKSYKEFRKWLFNECYVKKVYNFSILRKAPRNYGGQLFNSSICPVSILFYQNQQPQDISPRITYYAPKTYMKNHVLEGLIIDNSDVSYLPRDLCQNPDINIWKIAMWGSIEDWFLIEKLKKKYDKMINYLKKNKIDFGVGLEISPNGNKIDKEIRKLLHFQPELNEQYYVHQRYAAKINDEKFRRKGKKKAYFSPHILLNEGVKDKKIISSYLDFDCSFYKGIIGLCSSDDKKNMLKVITCFLNSEFTRYYAFIATSSWGIERDVIKYKELFQIPYILEDIPETMSSSLLDIFSKIKEIKSNVINKDITGFEQTINEAIYGQLSRRDRIIIEETLNNLDLFYNGKDSSMIKPPDDFDHYAEMMCSELNELLRDQQINATATLYSIKRCFPLALVKISFGENKRKTIYSEEDLYEVLNMIDKHLYSKESESIFFRKHLYHFSGDDIFIVKPNQRRFWTQKQALEDTSKLIIDILSHSDKE